MEQTDSVRSNLRQVGIVLIVVGILDICMMVYCIVRGLNYSSSLNIFAVIAGMLVYQGNLKAVHYVGFFSAFILGGLPLMLLYLLFATPVDLWWLRLKLNPGTQVVSWMIYLSLPAILIWAYRRVSRPEILEAVKAAFEKPVSRFLTHRTGFLFGVGLSVLLAVFLTVLPSREAKEKAIGMARQQVGEDYKFHVRRFNIHTGGGRTRYRMIVTAYSDHEIKDVPVYWEQ